MLSTLLLLLSHPRREGGQAARGVCSSLHLALGQLLRGECRSRLGAIHPAGRGGSCGGEEEEDLFCLLQCCLIPCGMCYLSQGASADAASLRQGSWFMGNQGEKLHALNAIALHSSALNMTKAWSCSWSGHWCSIPPAATSFSVAFKLSLTPLTLCPPLSHHRAKAYHLSTPLPRATITQPIVLLSSYAHSAVPLQPFPMAVLASPPAATVELGQGGLVMAGRHFSSTQLSVFLFPPSFHPVMIPKALGLLHSAQICSCANVFALLHTPHPPLFLWMMGWLQHGSGQRPSQGRQALSRSQAYGSGGRACSNNHSCPPGRPASSLCSGQ